jgi:hypothetical protein
VTTPAAVRGRSPTRDAAVVARAVVPRPSLWWAAAGAMVRMARRGWWHRAPFLPIPGEEYWQFRLVTAYGGSGEGGPAAEAGMGAGAGAAERQGEALTTADVVAFLQWCQRSRPRRG